MSTQKVSKVDKNVAKTIAKISGAKKTAKKVDKKPEQKYFANQLAEKIGIDKFEFLIIQRKAGIEDTTPITISEMKDLYKKYIE